MEGYPVVDHYGKTINPSTAYRLTISTPEMWTDQGMPKGNSRDMPDPWHYNHFITYNDLWKQFEDQGQGIKDYCDYGNCPLPHPSEHITPHDFVSLASILNSYCGIE